MELTTGWITVEEFCRLYYRDRLAECDKPTKSMRDSVSRMCRNGTVDSRKVGGKWFVRV